MKGEQEQYLCRACAFRGDEELFGLQVVYPKCKSRDVVLADAWARYHAKTLKRNNPKEHEKETE